MSLTPADLVRKYLELRAHVEARTKAVDDELAPYKAGMETIEGAVHKYLDDNGLDNLKTPDGTAFKKSGTRVRVVDRQILNDWVKANPTRIEFFTNAVAKELVLDYIKEHETPPPGIDFVRFLEVQFRKA